MPPCFYNADNIICFPEGLVFSGTRGAALTSYYFGCSEVVLSLFLIILGYKTSLTLFNVKLSAFASS